MVEDMDRKRPSAWRKALADLSGTRTQVTYLIVGLFAYITLQGAAKARTTLDFVALLGALTPALMTVLVYHFGGKWLEAKQNGPPIPPPKDHV